MAKPTLYVSAALIIDRQKRVLISRRPQDVHLAGYWEFPGGQIEKGESPQQALIREIKEELALDIVVGRLYLRDQFEYDRKFVDISFYICQQSDSGQEAQALEVAEWKRVPFRDLAQYRFPPADQALIDQLSTFDF